MWLVAGALLMGIVALGSGGGFEWLGFLAVTIAISLVSYGLLLPFLILSFTSAFYRERLKDLLRLPATDASPAVPAPVLVAEQESPQ
jgi:amino acid transporter